MQTIMTLLLCFLDQMRQHCSLDMKQGQSFYETMLVSRSDLTEGHLYTSYTNPFFAIIGIQNKVQMTPSVPEWSWSQTKL